MTSVIAFVGSFVLSWWFIAAVLFMSVVSDYRGSKRDNCSWATFYAVVGFVSLVWLLKPSAIMLGTMLILWIPLGIVWAIVKWKMRCNKVRYELKNKSLSGTEQGTLKSLVDIDKRKTTVTYWAVFFPVSIVSTCFVNVFDLVEYIITVKLGNVFKNMAEEAFK